MKKEKQLWENSDLCFARESNWHQITPHSSINWTSIAISYIHIKKLFKNIIKCFDFEQLLFIFTIATVLYEQNTRLLLKWREIVCCNYPLKMEYPPNVYCNWLRYECIIFKIVSIKHKKSNQKSRWTLVNLGAILRNMMINNKLNLTEIHDESQWYHLLEKNRISNDTSTRIHIRQFFIFSIEEKNWFK